MEISCNHRLGLPLGVFWKWGVLNLSLGFKILTEEPMDSLEVGYWHIKYGYGTILLDNELNPVGKVIKPNQLLKHIMLL